MAFPSVSHIFVTIIHDFSYMNDENIHVTTDSITVSTHGKDEFPPAHTAEHILNATMVRMFGCERSRVNHIERKKSKCNYHLSSCPTTEQIQAVEQQVNAIIAQDLPVYCRMVPRSEIPSSIDLSKLPDDADEVLRLVYVGDYDICPCAGAHIEHTALIGHFRISSTSFNDGNFRIVFRIDLPV